MDDIQFEQVKNDLLYMCNVTLQFKADEYAFGDRLSNFKRAGTFESTVPEKALRGMLTKHLVSVYDLIDDIAKGKPAASLDMWDSKIVDSINYFILLKGLLVERAASRTCG